MENIGVKLFPENQNFININKYINIINFSYFNFTPIINP